MGGLETRPLDVDVNDILANNAPFDRVEQATMDILKDTSIEGGYAGMAAIAAQDQRKNNLGDIKTDTAEFDLGFDVASIGGTETDSTGHTCHPDDPVLFHDSWTHGFDLGRDQFVEAFFGMMIFGLGVDFGLHLLVRMREEYQGDISFEDALRKTVLGAGPAIIAGAITTTGAFLSLEWLRTQRPDIWV